MQPSRCWLYLGLEQKRLYQRNFVYSWLVVLGMVIIGVATGVFLQGETDARDTVWRFGGNPAQTLRYRGQSGARTAGATLSGGFVSNVTITPDRSESEAVPAIRTAFSWRELPIPELDIGETSVAYPGLDESAMMDGIGGDADFGLPANPGLARPLMKVPGSSAFRPAAGGNDEDGLIIAGRIGWPGMPAADTDTGRVVVDITIFPDATIAYQFVTEEPPGKGFRRVTEQAIVYRFKYRPRKIDGEAIETRLRLSVTICLDCESSIAASDLEGFHVAME